MTNLHSVSIQHLAIIMDGNGRWAQSRGENRSVGHEKGAERVRAITQFCSDMGVSHLTLYAFSTENWKRPAMEVQFLMKLMTRYLKNELPLMQRNNIRFETIGDLSIFSNELRTQIARTKEATAANTGLTQVLALNYGARDEIVRAARKLADSGVDITAESLESHLDTADFPPVDMLIRTGGDVRLSNFLLWQAAYAELFFTQTLWPDFSEAELKGMMEMFAARERRFGGVGQMNGVSCVQIISSVTEHYNAAVKTKI